MKHLRRAIELAARAIAWADARQDPRVLGIYRISVAVVVLIDLTDRLRDAFTFYTDLGILSRADVVAVTHRFGPAALFQLAGSPRGVVGLLLFGFVAAGALLVGYRTRIANLLVWAFMLSIQDRNLAISDGGDTVVRLLLFWGLWCDLGAGYSADARRGAAPAGRGLGLRCVRAQLAIIYLSSVVSKTGRSWRNGAAIYYALSSTGFARPPGAWLLTRPTLSAALTFATLAIEIALPILILSPARRGACRAGAIGLGLALHLGIALAMRVGIFPFAMLACFTALIQPAWLDRLAGARASRAGAPAAPPPAPARPALSLTRLPLQLTPLLLLVAVGAEQCARRLHTPLPRLVSGALDLVEARQDWTMFAPEPGHASGRFEAPGELTDGSTIDVLARAAPHLGPGRWSYSRWEKLSLALRGAGNPYLIPFGRFLCRRYNGDTAGPRLARFKLVLVLQPTPPPGARGAAATISERHSYLDQSCVAPAVTAAAGTGGSSR